MSELRWNGSVGRSVNLGHHRRFRVDISDVSDITKRLEALEAVRSKGASADWKTYSDPSFSHWLDELRRIVQEVDPELLRSLDQVAFSPVVISPLVTDEEWKVAFRNGLNQIFRLIDSAMVQVAAQKEAILEALSNGKKPTNQTPMGERPSKQNEVFIVHGQDNECKQAVARFVEKLELRAVLLHEQANSGLGIFEKLERNAGVVYAIILLTPDDVGRLQKDHEFKPRARQNVIFEFGFFIGKLGRNRVAQSSKIRWSYLRTSSGSSMSPSTRRATGRWPSFAR